ncbi:hypothetical protein NLG97_g7340 [Lecanicillium saksenae]|uniref:Uncharacterized protein n=1 Tax=Lecanicillium saksenae TaxID=468837 RepID=A0ACC1QN90_9HYPO|nr:hypothetical protein NLG97_g7340 [Lecanicillium saksenae]
MPTTADTAFERTATRSAETPPANDAYFNSRDCFNTVHMEYIWIDSVNGTDYCTQGNWIREYANFLHEGSCSNNNRGQQNVEMGRCEKLQHYSNGAINTDSIRINYA